VAKKKRPRGRQAADAAAQGLEAFRRGDYDSAIAAWEKAREQKPSAELTTALAEVYFRRGVVRFHRHGQQETGLPDLDEAARLVPGEPRYAYHLGLAHHQRGDLATALTAYCLALAADPGFGRAAEMAVLAMLEQGENPLPSEAWKALAAARQSEFRALVALMRGEGVAAAPARSESEPTTAAGVWWTLAALQSGNGIAREAVRGIIQDDEQPQPLRALAAYALGFDALRRERLEEAQAHWEAARRLGLDTPGVRDNLAALYRDRAEEMMRVEQWAEAAPLVDAARDLGRADGDLEEIAIACHLRAGYDQAVAGRWREAAYHWAQARDLGEDSRTLAQNLALAYEKSERFDEAAELWREVVRRRPRKASAPDALTSEQVALLWGHVAECYRQAGDVEEAITMLRNAAKNDPDNTDLRLELVDALVANDQWDAASNEVGRILDREPDKVGALVRAARIDEMDGYLARARGLWKRILELEPGHLEAQDRLAELFLHEGARLLLAHKADEAIERFREAETYTPDEPHLYLAWADAYFGMKDREAARRKLERAFELDPTDLDVFHSAVDMCHMDGQPEDAEWVIARAKELAGPRLPGGRLPADFYLGIADCCFDRDQDEQGEDYVRRAEQAAEGDADGLVDVGIFCLDRDQDSRAMPLFDRALRIDPEHGWANFHAGYGYALAAEMREANRHWRQAARTARKTGDAELLEAVRMAREYFDRLTDMMERGLDPSLIMRLLDEDADEYW
jgi:tetratricopeptide (TPR) repeat protein